MINKADAADPLVLARLRAREPHSVVVSRQDRRGHRRGARRRSRPTCRGPASSSTALLPYERGDLINRLHEQRRDRLASSTPPTAPCVAGRANEDLAGELAAYAV